MHAITMRVIATLSLAVVFWIVNVVGSIKRPFDLTQGSDIHTAFLWTEFFECFWYAAWFWQWRLSSIACEPWRY
jgi:hypothetical protein